MNENPLDSLKPPAQGEVDESLKPPMGSAEADDALDASAELADDSGSLKPPATGS